LQFNSLHAIETTVSVCLTFNYLLIFSGTSIVIGYHKSEWNTGWRRKFTNRHTGR